MKRSIAMLGAALMLISGLVALDPPQRGDAADARLFDPSLIISDPLFYDSAAMTEAEIAGFLQAKIGTCLNTNCLNVVRVDTQSRSANLMCAAYTGALQESAARIIFKVQQACSISAKVLLVTLEKEQSLVTHKSPTLSRLDRAMGYACPDNTATPGWCDPAYGGLYNQLYWASWQMQRYSNPPGTSNYFTWYPVGSPSLVQFHPNTACGSSSITIKNKATAALYYYTPYQPNAAALANLYGTGDGCSSYGNRNFWRLYTDWFGSPTGPSPNPTGNWELASASLGKISLGGWMLDPDTVSPIDLHVYIDGAWGGAYTANVVRADVGAAYPGYGSEHGFAVDISVPEGRSSSTVCVFGINVAWGSNTSFGCRTVTFPGGSPFGNVEILEVRGGLVTIGGWALDPDVSAPVPISVTSNGASPSGLQSVVVQRPDVARFYPEYGTSRGFTVTFPMTVGSSDVCVGFENVGQGSNTRARCLRLVVTTGSPFGNLESISVGPGFVNVSGWLIDPDEPGPADIHAYVDGRWAGRIVADRPRADVGIVYPAFGPNHGFGATLTIPGGSSTVCLYGYNIRGGSNTTLRCVLVTAPTGSPFGNFELAAPTQDGATISGWVIDPDIAGPIDVHVYVNGKAAGRVQANSSRADVGRAYPLYGPDHGFVGAIAAPVGRSEICVYGYNVGGGSNRLLGCQVIWR
jgi:hypothetical protein